GMKSPAQQPSLRRAPKGTAPPELGDAMPASDMVSCKTCKTEIPFASAIILGTHCLCVRCSNADARSAALAAAPKNLESVKLPRTLGGPLAMLLFATLGTAALAIIYNVL